MFKSKKCDNYQFKRYLTGTHPERHGNTLDFLPHASVIHNLTL